ncbi:MAG: glycoside hydrolase family 3 C-terminal domain-containing protein [Janthinobacterium lividum]
MKKLFTKKLSLLLLVVMLLPALALVKRNKYQYKFQDPSLPVEDRVNDLVSKMTLDEKIDQMINRAPAIERLGIPAFNWWNEALHGVARTKQYKTTVYPQAIANAATFDSGSIHEMADEISDEGRAINNENLKTNNAAQYTALTYWSPNINIFRDPRWGRGQETYGEDPFLTASLGKAFVIGLQGNDPKYLKAAACAKHYAVHSGPEQSRHKFNVDVTNYDLWDTYLPAFKQLVVNAKVAGVMCAYNAFRGQPCCGSDILLNDILRNEWNFTGYLTSDCGAIDDFSAPNAHRTSPDAESAAADAVLHGTDVECIVGPTSYKSLVKAVKNGKLTEKQIDVSVKRLFTIRFRLGLFDPIDQVKYRQIPISELESPAHHAHALKMAHESIVLLKNENQLLPLKKNLKKIAVIGPNANNEKSILGNYNGIPTKLVTALQGIKDKLGANTEVVYKSATDYTTANPTLKATVDSIKNADVIVYVGGISPQLEGEEMRVDRPGFNGGDRTSILLPEAQTQLLKELKATGKPVVFVMMTGSAIAMPWESENIPAIVNAWYGGQDAGTALADVLFGDYNPAGRLPVTFYKSNSDLTADFDNYSMTNRTYRYFTGKPLYGFGFGLSYTTFKYDMLTTPAAIHSGKNTIVNIKVTNTGKMDGDEVTQLYISHVGVKMKAPLKALKGFERNFLKAGQSKIIQFELKPEDLMLVNEAGNSTAVKGKLMISIGGCQPDAQTQARKTTVSKTVSII